MPSKNLVRWALAVIPAACLAVAEDRPTTTHWSWQQTYAEVDPKGDLLWAPRPFVFEKGTSVRYIDFEAGDDANSGDTLERPWKHHPWDPQATGKATAGSGIYTYVFKGGVVYRGHLMSRTMRVRPGSR